MSSSLHTRLSCVFFAFFVVLILFAVPRPVRADVTLLLAESYGRAPKWATGHVSVHLSNVCAESPVLLRRCAPDEAGVVISRYRTIAGLDWIAVPVVPYLYAVEQAKDAPDSPDADRVQALRETYRRAHLRATIPDDASGGAPSGDWIQMVGAAYNRRIYAFRLPTDEARDDAVIAALNARQNTARFNVLKRNCADFAAEVINAYYPNSVRSSRISDLGITTPKHTAQALLKYGRRQGVDVTTFVIAQVPGSQSPSRKVRGVLESFVRTKKYMIPLLVVQPWIPAGAAAGSLLGGRFNPDRIAVGVYSLSDLERHPYLSLSDTSSREQVDTDVETESAVPVPPVATQQSLTNLVSPKS